MTAGKFLQRFAGVLICLALVALVWIAARCSSNNEARVAAASVVDTAVPTAEFIAAALRNQAATTIEADYSMPDRVEYHYIRTPGALSLTQRLAASGGVETVLSKRASYDLSSRETRVLTTNRDGTASGSVTSSWIGDPFNMFDILDPTMFVLPWGEDGPRPLCERIACGQVQSEREDIDGRSCWRVDVTQTAVGIQRCSVWIDPQVGFCPRRIEIVPADNTAASTRISFQDYRELSSGVWFPMRLVCQIPAISVPAGGSVGISGVNSRKPVSNVPVTVETRTSTLTATEATAGKVFPKDSLLVSFPSGTKLYVNGSSTPVAAP